MSRDARPPAGYFYVDMDVCLVRGSALVLYVLDVCPGDCSAVCTSRLDPDSQDETTEKN
jgi:hypothetical protein